MVVLGEGTVSYERGTPVAHTASRSLVTQEVQLVTSNYSTKPCSTGFGVAQADPPCRSSGVLVSIRAGSLGKEASDAPPARPKTAHAASRSLVTQEEQLVSIGPQHANPGDVDVPQQFSCTAYHVSVPLNPGL